MVGQYLASPCALPSQYWETTDQAQRWRDTHPPAISKHARDRFGGWLASTLQVHAPCPHSTGKPPTKLSVGEILTLRQLASMPETDSEDGWPVPRKSMRLALTVLGNH